MNSSRARLKTKAGGAPEIRANLEDGLIRDPRVLLDPRLLGVLHRELHERMGSDATQEILVQAGFFHGFRDALRAAGDGGAQAGASTFPMLALRFGPIGEGAAAHGALPEGVEAEAILATLGHRDGPSCFLSSGYASGWLSGLWERDIWVEESACAASGRGPCHFVARIVETGDSGEPTGPPFPYAKLREKVRGEITDGGPTKLSEASAFEEGSAAVHVWGPVMVVPYTGGDTAFAVESVANEPHADLISVVVIDLAGAVVDDGFGAVALERVVEVIQSWGAEAVIAGASPLSGRVVGSLGRGTLVVRDDLRTAIAAAFQIAEFQRFGM